MPRSNAALSIARLPASGRSSPKFCHSPNEIGGSLRPLRPQRRYFTSSYRLGAGTYWLRPGKDAPEVDLGRPVGRTVVVGQVKVGDAQVKCAPQHRAAAGQRAVVAEVLPQPQRDRRQLETAAPAAAILHIVVSAGGGHILAQAQLGIKRHWMSISGAAKSVRPREDLTFAVRPTNSVRNRFGPGRT